MGVYKKTHSNWRTASRHLHPNRVERRKARQFFKMPGSNCSGFSTASKQAIEGLRIENAAKIAAKDAEMEAERKKKDAEMI